MNKENEEEKNRAKAQAEAQFSGIKELLETLAKAQNNGNEEEENTALEAILNDPLSVEIQRQYIILLCTGGPAVRIIGELDEYDQPATARLQFQDWFTPWTDLDQSESESDLLVEYARHFYFERKEAA